MQSHHETSCTSPPTTGCRAVYFCGEECARRAWKEMGHKAECKAAAAARGGAREAATAAAGGEKKGKKQNPEQQKKR